MQVNRAEFLEKLSQVRPGLSSKDRVDQASSFIFSGGKIVSYNEHIMVVAPCPLDGIEGAVRAEELLSLLNKLTSEMADISVKDNQLIVKAGRSRSGIRFEEEVRIPMNVVMDEFEQTKEINIPEKLLSALDTARFCASKSMNDLKLTGVLVSGGKARATDKYRIISVDIPGSKKLPEFLLPASCIDSLFSYKPKYIGIGNAWAFFRNEHDVIFCARLLETSEDNPFPDVDSFLQVEGLELVLPTGILDALDKADIFTASAAYEADRFVELSLKPGRVIVRGEGQFGWYEESVPAKDYEGEPVEFAAHPQFLRQILPFVQKATLGATTILFEGENFRHVFVQSRPKTTETQGE